MNAIQTVTGSTFAARVLDAPGPVAVEFMSYGCVHCRAIEPAVQEAAALVPAGETIVRVNVGLDRELAGTYAIEATPTFVMFLNAREVGRVEGPQPNVSSVLAAVTESFAR